MAPDNCNYREQKTGPDPGLRPPPRTRAPPVAVTAPGASRTELSRQFDAFLDRARGAFSPNTCRAVRADLRRYAAWCEAQALDALPVTPARLAAFVDAMAAVRSPATVRRYVASIAAVQKAAGRGRAHDSAPVRHALLRMHRRKGRRQGQALGLTWPLRQRLIDTAGERLIDARNRALVALAYDALLRRSELVALQVSDLIEEMHGGGTLLVRRAKTDPEGRGAMVYVASDTLALLGAWRRRGGIESGRLFRSVSKAGVLGERLHPSQVPRIFKSMAQRAGLPEELVARLSGHSARVGAAQDMVASGIELPAILQAGRWKSTVMVNRYGERLLARRSGAAQLARLQRRE